MRRSSQQQSAAKLIFYAADRFADTLHQQAVEEANWDEVREAGGIDLLVSLLKLGPCRASAQAAAALTHLAHSAANRDAIRESGGIALLVALLTQPQQGSSPSLLLQPPYDWLETATNAAAALRNLTHNNSDNQDAIREARGVEPLIGLLSQGASSSAASRAADALGGLARNTHRANQIAIREAGGIEQLVTLLHAQPIGEAATKAAGALKHLAFAYSVNREAIREAGGIEPLVALLELRRDIEEDVMIIAGALWNLGYNNPYNQDSIREAGGVRCASACDGHHARDGGGRAELNPPAASAEAAPPPLPLRARHARAGGESGARDGGRWPCAHAARVAHPAIPPSLSLSLSLRVPVLSLSLSLS